MYPLPGAQMKLCMGIEVTMRHSRFFAPGTMARSTQQESKGFFGTAGRAETKIWKFSHLVRTISKS